MDFILLMKLIKRAPIFIGVLLIIIITEPLTAAVAPLQGDGIRLDARWPVRTYTRIRVKIFPHTRAYPPHGSDKVRDRITLVSDKNCRMFAGLKNKTGRRSRLLKKGKRFKLNAASLSQPVWIKCGAPVTLIRPGAKDSWRYAGEFYVRRQGSGLEVVNVVGIETYLRGVVPAEVYADWPEETLKTQAVAARTYSVYHLSSSRQRGKRYWDVDDTVQFQAYTGLSFANPRTDKAIRATRGEILTWGSRVIQAYYHADSGGRTEYADKVWSFEVPWCQSRKEVYADSAVRSDWKVAIKMIDFARWLRRNGHVPRGRLVQDVVVPATGRTTSGRVRFISIRLDDGTYRNLSLRRFRRFFAVNVLPSSLFAFERKDKRTLILRGRGSGHGVGMNQRGSRALAKEKGWDYGKILDFYYSGTSICSLARKNSSKRPCYPAAGRADKDSSIAENDRFSTRGG